MAETIEQIAQRLARAMYGRFAVYGDKYDPNVEFSKALVAELVKEQKPVAIVRRGINAYSLLGTTGLEGIDGLPDGTALYPRPVVAAPATELLRDGAEAIASEAFRHAVSGGHISDLYKLPKRCELREALSVAPAAPADAVAVALAIPQGGA